MLKKESYLDSQTMVFLYTLTCGFYPKAQKGKAAIRDNFPMTQPGAVTEPLVPMCALHILKSLRSRNSSART